MTWERWSGKAFLRKWQLSCVFQYEQVKKEREAGTTGAKALWWKGTRRIQVPEGGWPKSRSTEKRLVVWGGGWRSEPGPEDLGPWGPVEEVKRLP